MGILISKRETPWKNGIWWCKLEPTSLIFVDGENVQEKNAIVLDFPDYPVAWHEKSTWRYGNYGETNAKIFQATGNRFYNVKIKNWYTVYGVLNKEGTKLYVEGFATNIPAHDPYYLLELISDEELEQFKANRQSALSPICPYVVPNPDSIGKLIWISGPPGSGKSTTAQIFARDHGFIHYQVDCFNNCVNPFTDVNADSPTLAQTVQMPLKVK